MRFLLIFENVLYEWRADLQNTKFSKKSPYIRYFYAKLMTSDDPKEKKLFGNK